MYFIGVTEGKIIKLKNKSKVNISNLTFIYTIHFAYLRCTQNFKTLAPRGAEKSVTEIFIGEREK